MIGGELLQATYVTVEPIMDFDLGSFVALLKQAKPHFINIGADSKGGHLPEPPAEKVRDLLAALEENGIEVRIKKNLRRIIGEDI